MKFITAVFVVIFASILLATAISSLVLMKMGIVHYMLGIVMAAINFGFLYGLYKFLTSLAWHLIIERD